MQAGGRSRRNRKHRQEQNELRNTRNEGISQRRNPSNCARATRASFLLLPITPILTGYLYQTSNLPLYPRPSTTFSKNNNRLEYFFPLYSISGVTSRTGLSHVFPGIPLDPSLRLNPVPTLLPLTNNTHSPAIQEPRVLSFTGRHFTRDPECMFTYYPPTNANREGLPVLIDQDREEYNQQRKHLPKTQKLPTCIICLLPYDGQEIE